MPRLDTIRGTIPETLLLRLRIIFEGSLRAGVYISTGDTINRILLLRIFLSYIHIPQLRFYPGNVLSRLCLDPRTLSYINFMYTIFNDVCWFFNKVFLLFCTFMCIAFLFRINIELNIMLIPRLIYIDLDLLYLN